MQLFVPSPHVHVFLSSYLHKHINTHDFLSQNSPSYYLKKSETEGDNPIWIALGRVGLFILDWNWAMLKPLPSKTTSLTTIPSEDLYLINPKPVSRIPMQHFCSSRTKSVVLCPSRYSQYLLDKRGNSAGRSNMVPSRCFGLQLPQSLSMLSEADGNWISKALQMVAYPPVRSTKYTYSQSRRWCCS